MERSRDWTNQARSDLEHAERILTFCEDLQARGVDLLVVYEEPPRDDAFATVTDT